MRIYNKINSILERATTIDLIFKNIPLIDYYKSE